MKSSQRIVAFKLYAIRPQTHILRILFIYFNLPLCFYFNFLFRMIYASTVKYDIYCIQLNVFKMNRYILMFYLTALWFMVILLHYIPPPILLDSTPAHSPPLHFTSLHSNPHHSAHSPPYLPLHFNFSLFSPILSTLAPFPSIPLFLLLHVPPLYIPIT